MPLLFFCILHQHLQSWSNSLNWWRTNYCELQEKYNETTKLQKRNLHSKKAWILCFSIIICFNFISICHYLLMLTHLRSIFENSPLRIKITSSATLFVCSLVLFFAHWSSPPPQVLLFLPFHTHTIWSAVSSLSERSLEVLVLLTLF